MAAFFVVVHKSQFRSDLCKAAAVVMPCQQGWYGTKCPLCGFRGQSELARCRVVRRKEGHRLVVFIVYSI